MEHRTQNTEHRTQNTEHRTQNTEHGTRNTEHGHFTNWMFLPFFIVRTVFFTFLSCALLPSAVAQIQSPVGLPTSKVSEIAKYRVIDLWKNSELSTFENEIVSIEADNFVTRVKSSANAAPRTVRADRSWNAYNRMQNSEKTICDGSMRFPMQVGNKHSYKEHPNAAGLSHFSASCQVTGEEKVTVPAGTFDTLRTECSGFWQRVFGGNWNGKFDTVTWYAPALSRSVKFQFSDTEQGAPANKTQTELTEFTVAK